LQTSLRYVVFAFAAGVIVGLAIHTIANRDPGPESTQVAVIDTPGAAVQPRPPANAPAPVERDAALAPDAPVAMTSVAAANGSLDPATASATAPGAVQQPPIPPAVLADDLKARPAPLNRLLNASSLRCDIDVAHGANWSQGKATLHAINYGGGPFSLESIDLEAETAMMSGGSGVTGSLNGELEMRTTAGNKGLTFSAFTRYGDLLMVTVYPALDSSGRFRTVMTTFGDQFDHETAQFFGACDITLAQR
jgi:hypothetical protein